MTRFSKTRDNAFSPIIVIVVALVGVVTFAGLGILSAYAPELRSGNDGGDHALSRAATGFGGLPPLLRELGEPVLLSRAAVFNVLDQICGRPASWRQHQKTLV